MSESLETIAAHGAAVYAMMLAGFTLLIYDHILTLSDEVNYIWNSRKGLVSIIFLLNRYIVPLVLAVDIYAIVAWRLYALHGGTTWIRRTLWISGLLYVVSSTGIITASLIPVILDLQPYYHQCVSSIPSYLWTAWLPSVIFETLLFGLTIVAMIRQDKRRSFTTLSLLLYRDGMLYFVAVTVCSSFSLLVWALAPSSLIGLARYFALAMVNIAGSRLVLNLKGYSASRNSLAFCSSPYQYSHYSSDVVLTPQRAQHEEPTVDLRDDDVDLEMYSMERDCQQLGTKLLHQL
ncbi:uncharacterized protein FIBRA_05590 [Fibroporia radiculosa]|uniref:DUF6533 domain-containing protein n=1 Tax=Fibroporia radiculosa TaxID=599839 RepID=J4HXT0_9APHY|nr:uncharacterized protein FIBRA_05590 [Fibroporia radiculosa]CCM03457.1 predicted protein [Fibroporia radiculosa]